MAGWVFVGCVLALCAPWGNIPRDQADSAGMLAHLHAHFVAGDLLFDDEYARLGMSPLFAFVTSEGVVSNHWPAGATWLQLPGYALGVTAGRVLEALGIGRASELGVVAVLGVRAWACLVLSLIAWVITRAAAHAANGRLAVGGVVAAAFVVGTPLLYYAIEAPLRPHLWAAACVLAVVACWAAPRTGPPLARTLVLALLVGLATAVRPQLATLSLLVVHDAWPGAGRTRRLLVAFVGGVAWPGLHIRAQLWMYGDSLTDYAGQVTTHLRLFLLSPHHGALVWCPVLLIFAAAVVRSAWLRERGALLVALLLAHQIWLDAGSRPIEPMSVLGTRTWAGGAGFAARKLVDVLPLALPAVYSLVAAGACARWGKPLLGLAVICCMPTALLHAAAVLSPDATTGAIVDATALGDLLALPFSAQAWRQAWSVRQLPLAVAAVVSVVVTLPLLVAGLRCIAVARTLPRTAAVHLTAAVLVGSAVAANLWLSVLLVRSDAALVDDPERMPRAAATMDPVHRATVAAIEGYHAQMRQRLGDDAAP